MTEVLVVIGVGGMGETIARRQAPGKITLLADFNEAATEAIAERMHIDGFDVRTQKVDVSSRESLEALAATAASLGLVTQVVHTAGLSPTQAPLDAILRVDLVGVALMIEIFAEVVAPGAAGVVISSSSGYLVPGFTPEQEAAIRSTSPEALLDLPFFSAEVLGNAGVAYGTAKRANRVQVQNASALWGSKGARINTVSPGVISTAMGRQELESPSGAFMRAMVENSGTGRLGTPSDIADGVTFLLGHQASFITGIDLLIDGGSVAAVLTGRARPGTGE
jgi:NAD(P)-dependent dehydrogenase (short-subunit alcohol dehydrogenase family)